MTPSPQHPLEGLYQAREALESSAGAQERIDVAEVDWPAYGSALVGVLNAVDHFTQVLVSEIDQVDRERLYQRALRDHPHDALDRAVGHLRHLRQALLTAMPEIHGYWEQTQHAREDIDGGPRAE